jgi:hypothetical protein
MIRDQGSHAMQTQQAAKSGQNVKTRTHRSPKIQKFCHHPILLILDDALMGMIE